MGSPSGNQIVGYKYFMSIFFGLCRGPIDAIIQIKVGDLTAWTGEVISSNSGVQMDSPALFGGDYKEGGIKGFFAIMFGDATQFCLDFIAATIGGAMPGFRGITTVWYDGEICANNPYPKPWKFRVWRGNNGWDGDPWYPEKTVIIMFTSDYTQVTDPFNGQIAAMNPAHIVYECTTNRDWGRGLDRSMIDDDSFTSCANQLCMEGFGLCLKWDRTTDVSDFIQSVIDTIGAVLYVDRSTGLYSMRLIRQDYSVPDLPVLDYNSGLLEVLDADTQSSDVSYNEMIVQYHNPVTDQDCQVRVHNLASVQANGGALFSMTKSYMGIPTPDLAMRVCQRDLRAASAGLKKFTIKTDRRGYNIVPGMPFVLNIADRGINMVVRAMAIADSELTDGKLTFQCIQDVFGLPSTTFNDPVVTNWTPPDSSAQPIVNQVLHEATYRELYQQLGATDVATYPDSANPILFMAKKPTSLSLSYDFYTLAVGEAAVMRGTEGFTPTVKLATSLGLYDNTLTFTDSDYDLLSTVPLPACFQIDQEQIRVDFIDFTHKTMTIGRGCVDSLPAVHAPGTLAWLRDYGVTDKREYSDGEQVEAYGATRTSSKVLDPSLAAQTFLVMANPARHIRPYPPAALKVNGTLWGNAPGVGGTSFITGDITFTWAHRERVWQADFLTDYTQASTGPEPGGATVFRVYGARGATFYDYVVAGSPTTWTYTAAQMASDGVPNPVHVSVFALVGSVPSMQWYELYINHGSAPATPAQGYGIGYGENYGG